MKYIASFSGGKDSAATIILAHLHNEPLDEIIFSEVMFDENTSGEYPAQMDFIKNTCAPLFEKWGYKFTILHSDKNFLDMYNHIVTRSKTLERNGKKSGFPMGGRCFINSRCKIPPIKQYLKTVGEVTQYIGIAADEREREKRLKNNQISLLCKYGLTEKDAQELAAEYGLLSPIYNYAKRGGCFFCPNATINEITYLYKNNFELFQKLKELENKPNVIGAVFDTRKKRSLADIERIIKNENQQQELLFY